MLIKKRENEVITLKFDFTLELEELWRPGTEYTTGSFVRPRKPNGYEYEATTGGQSSHREPYWPTTVAATVSDGSITWTARAYGNNATDTISTRTVTTDTGLTVANDAIDGETVTVDVSSGKKLACYDVVCQIVTVAGETLELVAKVEIVD